MKILRRWLAAVAVTATPAVTKKVAGRPITATITPAMGTKVIRATSHLITTIRVATANMVKNIRLGTTAKKVAIIKVTMKKVAIIANITPPAKATKVGNLERRKDTKRDRRPPGIITNLTKMTTTKNTNSTMTTTRVGITPNTVTSMDIMEANLDTTRREVATRADTMTIITERKDIPTKDTMKMITKDSKGTEDTKAIIPIILIMERREDIPEARNTVSVVVENTKDFSALRRHFPKTTSTPRGFDSLFTPIHHDSSIPISSTYCCWSAARCFIQVSFMLITLLPVLICVTKKK
ncbi:hypothetical protein BDFB_005288 [Asbolus verrucosus]|uniref:Uncharacterized protein n=1 Tax=Asbolus verrucosus TaxID=1661398 RepID=A0A482WB91_ASBVE|nr:hypothetical protein BDFB_005288 [Asbolus verrucosus]